MSSESPQSVMLLATCTALHDASIMPGHSLVWSVKLRARCGVQGFDQRMIDLYLDAFRTEARIECAGGAGRVLISPFSSEQPASSHVRYHMPPRFSKEVVRGIRHAAAKAFQVSCLGFRLLGFWN